MSKPAIIFITCDELNKDVLGYNGGKAITTPNIDNLSANGTTYDKCYTSSPWCLPARCSMLTGLYPHNSGAYSNFRKCTLDNGIDNMFFELKDAGYQTTVFGKCHFAPVPYGDTQPDKTLPYDEFREYYLSLGIDHLDLEDDKQVSVWFYDDYSKELDKAGFLKPYRDAVWDKKNQKVFEFPGPTKWHPDVWVGQKATDYIQQYEDDKPLFAWVSFSGPHYTFDSPKEYLQQVDRTQLPEIHKKAGELDEAGRIHHDSYFGGENANIDGCGPAKEHACKNYSDEYWDDLRTNYCANVKLIDDQVGDIINAVKEKYGENALIIFTADHGEMLGNHGLWGKHNCAYDEVWNIPLLIKYPNQNEAVKAQRFASSVDFMPTFVDVATGKVPKCDGHSLIRDDWTRQYVYAEGEGFAAIFDGKHKYVHVQKGSESGRELLDKINDPHEYENKINLPEYEKILADLREKEIEHLLPALLG